MSNELWSLDLNGSKKNELNLLKEQTQSLVINWLSDKDWYKLVFEAKNKVVKARTSIEAEAKKLTEDARIYVNKVNESKRELLSIISDEEARLKLELQKYDEEKERVANEEKEKQKKIFEERIRKLTEIKCIPDNLFAIGNMTEDEYVLYYQTKFNRYQLDQKEQFSINLITSSNTLDELEELENTETFYWSEEIKAIFDKRFNELKAEEKRKEQEAINEIIYQINSCMNLKDLWDIPFFRESDSELLTNTFNQRKEFLIKQEEWKRIADSINKIIQCKTLNELKDLKDLEDIIEVQLSYTTRFQFLEQQEELRKIKEEQEKQRIKEQEEQRVKEQEEQKVRKIKEARLADIKNKILTLQTEEELRTLYFQEDIQDLIPEVKHIFTERKQEILAKVKQEQQQKEFQDFLQSINYNKEDCIIQKTWWETLIYKLIGKWNK